MALCNRKTGYPDLNAALERLHAKREGFLAVLSHPHLPLHNNLSENDIREYARLRKISAGTRSDQGRRCRDTFLSLKKTCRKLGVSFWSYLGDRIHGTERDRTTFGLDAIFGRRKVSVQFLPAHPNRVLCGIGKRSRLHPNAAPTDMLLSSYDDGPKVLEAVVQRIDEGLGDLVRIPIQVVTALLLAVFMLIEWHGVKTGVADLRNTTIATDL